MTPLTFDQVFRSEIASINRRRAASTPTRSLITLDEGEASGDTGEKVLHPSEASDLVGLSLSGGGIRSAAFALGVLQALEETKVLSRCDYLSTVSGGGYIGSSLSAALQTTKGIFPFRSELEQDETPSLQHLRDNSNYLFPRRQAALLHNASIYVRGLIANLVLILPFLLLGAALTLFINKTTNSLGEVKILFWKVPNLLPYKHFVITTYIGFALLAALVIWALAQSSGRQDRVEVPSRWSRIIGIGVLVMFVAAFCELQPVLLEAMSNLQATNAAIAKAVSALIAVLTPFATIVAFFSQKLAELVRSSSESSRWRDQLAGFAGKAAIYLAALVVPVLLWAAYLYLTYWGLCTDPNTSCAPHWLGLPLPWLYVLIALALLLFSLVLRPNANSLHRLYRDRLSKTFLFVPRTTVGPKETLEPLRLRLERTLRGICALPADQYSAQRTEFKDSKSARAQRRFLPF